MTGWVDGDYLTPANLNSKGVGPGTFTDHTVNAADYAGATDEAKITAAIADAVLLGYSYVFVPKSMLPYTTASVTFNNAVRMVREGQDNWDELDVQAYGTSPAGVVNSTPGIQAAFDATAASGFNQGCDVYFPPTAGYYRLGSPVWLKTPCKVHGKFPFTGASPGQNSKLAGIYQGPCILAANALDTVPTVTALLTGAGSAVRWTDNTQWFNLRDALTCELNGLATFTAEATVKPDSNVGDQHIACSAGQYLSADSSANCFDLRVSGGVPGFRVLLTSGLKQLSGGTITVGVKSHIAGSYDGTTVRLYVDGTLVASTAGTGTLVQGKSEDVTIGPSMNLSPDIRISGAAFLGTLDSIRLSNSARYVAGFTAPTAKFASDSQTIALMNFASQIGPATLVNTKDGDFWACLRNANQGGGIAGATFEDLVFASAVSGWSSGIFFGRNATYSTIKRLSFVDIRIGIAFFGTDSYGGHIEQLYFSGGLTGRYGLQGSGNSALTSVKRIDCIASFSVPLVWAQASTSFEGVFIQSSTDMVFGALLHNQNVYAPNTLTEFVISVEAGVGSVFRGPMALGGGAGADMRGCTLEGAGSSPLIIADSIVELQADRTCSFVSSAATSVVNILGTPPTFPMRFRSYQRGTWAPWSDVAGTASVEKLGKGVAATFSATPTFSANVRDAFEITLTGNVTSSTLQYHTPGQRLSWRIIQSGGPWTFAWPTNVKGGGVVGTGSNVQEFEVGLDSNAYAVAAMVTGM